MSAKRAVPLQISVSARGSAQGCLPPTAPARKQSASPETNSARDLPGLGPLHWSDLLGPTHYRRARLRTKRGYRLGDQEKSNPIRCIRHRDSRLPRAPGFRPAALKWRTRQRNVRKNQVADERGIRLSHCFDIPRALTNSENVGCERTAAPYG